MLTKDNAKANVITAKETAEQIVREQVEMFCEKAVSSQVERASKTGLKYAWIEAPTAIISNKKAVSEYLRTAGGFTDEDITWQGKLLRVAWGE